MTGLGGANPKSTVFAIANQVSDSVTFLEFEAKDFDVLKTAIEVSRVVKDEFEVALIRKANEVSDIAHRAVVENTAKAKNERELEAIFLQRCVANGGKEMAYSPIFASGRAAATLHYVKNDEPLDGKLNLLLDAGAEWNNYASDIVSGPTSVPSVWLSINLTPCRPEPSRCRASSPRNLEKSTTLSSKCKRIAPTC